MLTSTITSDVPTITPDMVEGLTLNRLHEWHRDALNDMVDVARMAHMLDLDRSEEITRLMGCAAQLLGEIVARRDARRVIAYAEAFVQGVQP